MSKKSVDNMKFPLEGKYVIMIAPSFVVDFPHPGLISMLRKLGFDKVVELTFGAKMINREYVKKLKSSKKMLISSACPGIVSTVSNRFPEYADNIIKVDSPMVAMAKICKKNFKNYKVVFLSPCDFKKFEAENSKFIDYVIDYDELRELFEKHKIRKPLFVRDSFDKFYNDYTKIFPLSGGLTKTANIKKVLKDEEFVEIDGIAEVVKFLENPNKKVKFVDCLFCVGGCIGGPHTNKELSINKKTKKVMNYLKKSKKEDIPEDRKGLIEKAEGIRFSR